MGKISKAKLFAASMLVAPFALTAAYAQSADASADDLNSQALAQFLSGADVAVATDAALDRSLSADATTDDAMTSDTMAADTTSQVLGDDMTAPMSAEINAAEGEAGDAMAQGAYDADGLDPRGEGDIDADDSVEDAAGETGDWIEDAGDDAGDALDDAAEESTDWVEDAADDTGDALDEAGDDIEDAADDAADAVDDAADDVEDELDDPKKK